MVFNFMILQWWGRWQVSLLHIKERMSSLFAFKLHVENGNVFPVCKVKCEHFRETGYPSSEPGVPPLPTSPSPKSPKEIVSLIYAHKLLIFAVNALGVFLTY